jgi:hypothetical protein
VSDETGAGEGAVGESAGDTGAVGEGARIEDERWLVIDGRRWRRTDPVLPDELVERLKSQLGRARSAVRAGRRADDADGIARARRRVDLAKHGLGERGPAWWECEEIDRLARAEAALGQLRRLDGPGEV